MMRFTSRIRCVGLFVVLVASGRPATAQDAADVVATELQQTTGLCVQIGINRQTFDLLTSRDNLLVHCLDPDQDSVDRLQKVVTGQPPRASLVVEHWTNSWLPYADNLVNLAIVNADSHVNHEEVKRVIRPGGVALFRTGSNYVRFVKPVPADTDEWTHQWHATDGGLTSEDNRIGIPTGLQWLSGPLFAMSGRKSSTQSLVSSGGINFYVTQNVLENVGRPVTEMPQFLVARDSYNGLILWKRAWTGPFVTGNGETNPRLVATPQVLYAVENNRTVIGIDSETGKTIADFQIDQDVDKILWHRQQLLIQSGSALTAIDGKLKELKWVFEGDRLSSLTVTDDQAYLLSSGRSPDGRFRHELICVDSDNGTRIFGVNTQPYVSAARVRINFASAEFVALQAHGSLHMFAADDGRHLWSKATEARPGKTYVDERYVGHFFRHGLVWMLSRNSPREPEGQNTWLGLHPVTGKMVRELKTQGEWPRTATPAKMGCQLLIASDRYIMIPRQSTFIDFESGEKHSFKFTRGGCGLGFVPANGLLYSHPHACGCFSEAVRGFMAMHSSSDPREPLSHESDQSDRLTFRFRPDLVDTTPAESADGWSTYRGSSSRHGFSKSELNDNLQLLWSAKVAPEATTVSRLEWKLRTGNAVSACTVSNGRVFVADVDAGRLAVLDAESGERIWDFHAAGRIDSPPTVWRGLCLFGSHDGSVYCLEAATGQLCWKFRVAPTDRRMIAFGGIESVWPVAGATVVRDGVVYAAAGRAPDADGGIEVVALNAETGSVVWTKPIEGGNFKGLCDYLVDGTESVYLSNWQFDPETGDHREVDSDSRHLQGGKVGLLEASWTKHDLAVRKDIQTWTAEGISGQLLAFSPDVTAAWNAESGKVLIDGGEHFELQLPPGQQVTAMAITSSHLVIAGGTERGNVMSPGFLRLIDLDTGDVTGSHDLPAESAFDGLAIRGDCVLVSTQDGFVSCFSTSD